jgi:hypothetical protein
LVNFFFDTASSNVVAFAYVVDYAFQLPLGPAHIIAAILDPGCGFATPLPDVMPLHAALRAQTVVSIEQSSNKIS